MRVERMGNATLYLGDCRGLEIAADLLLTDPPYGVCLDPRTVAKRRHNDNRIGREGESHGHDWRPVLGDDQPFDPGHLMGFPNAVLWGANNYASRLPDSPCWFSWDRKAGKAADSDITDCELAWVQGLPFKTVRKFSHMWAGVQRDSEVGQKHLHPTQKPVALFGWCLAFFPNARIVYDPYMGSGSCGVAAIKAGRSFIGVELDPAHFETARKRIDDAVRNPDLFVAQVREDPSYMRTSDLFSA